MRQLLTVFFISLSFLVRGQIDSVALKEIKAFQDELNRQYSTAGESPLPAEEIPKFKGHEFFPVDLSFRVTADLIVSQNEKPFKMKTANKDKDYIKYGELHFKLDGKPCKLNVYQSLTLIQDEKYKNHLFLPFTDLTSNFSTYGGGRYIDLEVPAGKTLILDFNQAYNPYCAYATGYSCPIPPKENFLDLKVEAGIKYTDHDH